MDVIGLSIYSECQYVDGMLGAGAAGYVLKDLTDEQLVPAIHAVSRQPDVYQSRNTVYGCRSLFLMLSLTEHAG